MSSHVNVELLSAYLDRQLADVEARRLEAHLDECEQCHTRLEGLRRVVRKLHKIEASAPPRELEQLVARRIVLAQERENPLDRLEAGLSIFKSQSSILPMFGVVIALALFMYLLSVAVDQSRNDRIPVVFDVPNPQAPSASTESTEPPLDTTRVAGATFRDVNGVWVQDGLTRDNVTRIVERGSEAWSGLQQAHPHLRDLTDLEGVYVLRAGDEIVEAR